MSPNPEKLGWRPVASRVGNEGRDSAAGRVYAGGAPDRTGAAEYDIRARVVRAASRTRRGCARGGCALRHASVDARKKYRRGPPRTGPPPRRADRSCPVRGRWKSPVRAGHRSGRRTSGRLCRCATIHDPVQCARTRGRWQHIPVERPPRNPSRMQFSGEGEARDSFSAMKNRRPRHGFGVLHASRPRLSAVDRYSESRVR